MSVQRNEIAIIGQKFSYDTYKGWSEDEQDQFDKKYVEAKEYDFDKHKVVVKPWDNQLTCIFDGMNGEYIIFGHIIGVSQAEFGDQEGIPTKEYTNTDLEGYFLLVEDQIKKRGLATLFLVNPKVKLYIFSYIS